MQMEDVTSSNIAAIGWEDETLHVRFNNGRTYQYERVSEGTFHAMQNAGSVGQFFHLYIKNQYQTSEV